MKKNRDYTTTVLILLALIGALCIFIATPYGIGTTPDSASYIGSARNLLSGRGLTVPIIYTKAPPPLVHYPPLLPLLLAGIGLVFGIDPFTSARWLNMLLFGANILLVGIILKKHTRVSFLPVIGSFIILTSPHMVILHSMAWTEPLFLFFELVGLYTLSTYLETKQDKYLLAGAICVSLAFLDRYPGVALVATGFCAVILWHKGKIRKRILDSLKFLVISILPIAIWMIRNAIIVDNATNRKILFHPILLKRLKGAIATLSVWLSPEGVPPLLRALFLLIVTLGLGYVAYQKALQKNEYKQIPTFLKVSALFLVMYALLLAISVSFFDASIYLNPRILSPTFVILVIMLIYLLDKAWGKKPLYSQLIVGGICTILLISYPIRGGTWLWKAHKEGVGYTSKHYLSLKTVQWVQNLPKDIKIFTNHPTALYLLTNREMHIIPLKENPITQERNALYSKQLAEMEEQMRAHGALLVYIRGRKTTYLPNEEELKSALPLALIEDLQDGAVYTVEEKLPTTPPRTKPELEE